MKLFEPLNPCLITNLSELSNTAPSEEQPDKLMLLTNIALLIRVLDLPFVQGIAKIQLLGGCVLLEHEFWPAQFASQHQLLGEVVCDHFMAALVFRYIELRF